MSSFGELSEIRIQPTSFRRDHVAHDRDLELASLVFVLDRQEEMPPVGRLRDWTLQALRPQPGETAVDVGCGTGAEVVRLAARVGAHGRAVGVEPHEGLREEAVARATAVGSTATFVDGDAGELPFDDDSVHVLRSERVWQHLPDPEAAAREAARVLAPGGRVSVVDSDWGTAVIRPGDPEVVRRYQEASWRRMANPFAGRHLRAQLQAVGLEVEADIGSAALVLPDELLTSGAFFRENAALSVEEGMLTSDEADALVRGVAEAAQRGEAFVAVTMFSVVARKPR